MNHSSSDRAMAGVVSLGVVGLFCLVLSFLPVGSDYSRLLLGASMPGAVMFSWIAGGLGLYSIVRYPSRRLFLATMMAVSCAALCGVRFWRLALTA